MSGFLAGDASLKVTKALPNGAATVYSDGIDLGISTRGDFLAQVELLLSAPAMATGVLGDAATMKYSIEHDDAEGFGTVAALQTDFLVQTGAGGAGAAAASKRFRFPTNVKRYVRIKAVNSAAGNASAVSLTAEVLS